MVRWKVDFNTPTWCFLEIWASSVSFRAVASATRRASGKLLWPTWARAIQRASEEIWPARASAPSRSGSGRTGGVVAVLRGPPPWFRTTHRCVGCSRTGSAADPHSGWWRSPCWIELFGKWSEVPRILDRSVDLPNMCHRWEKDANPIPVLLIHCIGDETSFSDPPICFGCKLFQLLWRKLVHRSICISRIDVCGEWLLDLHRVWSAPRICHLRGKQGLSRMAFSFLLKLNPTAIPRKTDDCNVYCTLCIN